jgi:hypothetical protein
MVGTCPRAGPTLKKNEEELKKSSFTLKMIIYFLHPLFPGDFSVTKFFINYLFAN